MSDYERIDYNSSGQRPWVRWLILVGLAFIGGLLSMGWILTRWDAASPYLSWLKPRSADVTAAESDRAPSLFAGAAATSGPVERRVAELEQRIGHIAARANAASGNADRAEGLLVAFAARRAVDRGLELGYIESLLRERFGRTQPQAVATIISAARQPITLDELRAELDAVAPELAGAGTNANWWDSIRRELAGAIVVRRAELPSATPNDRLVRARRSLEADHVDRALAEVARLPARDKATLWMTRARRYIAAHNALDLIETSALLMPSDGQGELAEPLPVPATRPAARPDAL